MKQTQKHGIPALLSFFCIGLGQIVKGDIEAAVRLWAFTFIDVIVSIVLIHSSPQIGVLGILLLFIGLPALWMYNVYDAYNN